MGKRKVRVFLRGNGKACFDVRSSDGLSDSWNPCYRQCSLDSGSSVTSRLLTINATRLHCFTTLAENKYNASYSDSLADGSRFFLLGQDYHFGCLLIADARLADIINVGLKQTIGEDSITELDHKIDKLDGSVFEFIQLHWLPPGRLPQDFKRVEVVNLCQMLEKKSGGEDSGEKNESLKLIYRTFNEVVRKYDVPDTAMDKLDELFITKFKELSSVPSASIKVTSLMAEIGKALKSLGCQKRNEEQC